MRIHGESIIWGWPPVIGVISRWRIRLIARIILLRWRLLIDVGRWRHLRRNCHLLWNHRCIGLLHVGSAKMGDMLVCHLLLKLLQFLGHLSEHFKLNGLSLGFRFNSRI